MVRIGHERVHGEACGGSSDARLRGLYMSGYDEGRGS